MGVRGTDDEERVRRLLAAIPVLAFDGEAAEVAGRVGAALRREGRPLALADLAIAGICLWYDASLLTRNHAHFERIPNLRLVRSSGPG